MILQNISLYARLDTEIYLSMAAALSNAHELGHKDNAYYTSFTKDDIQEYTFNTSC
jgi:hypothetical protein